MRRARATLTRAAASLRASNSGVIAQRVEERCSRIQGVLWLIDPQSHSLRFAAPACWHGGHATQESAPVHCATATLLI
jgi:hypothetical protein